MSAFRSGAILLIFWIAAHAFISATTPDFAYPKKVLANTDKQLSLAIKTNNSPKIVRAIIDMGLAQTEISNNSLQSTIQKISAISDSSNDSALISVFALLKADIYNAIYSRNRWKFDRRQLPDFPCSDNFNEWSGKQFKATIDSLITIAISSPQITSATPLSQWKDVVEYNPEYYNFFPTLFDFITYKSISILSNISDYAQPLSSKWIVHVKEFNSLSIKHLSPYQQRIISLYRQLLFYNQNRPDAEFYANYNRLVWTLEHAQLGEDQVENSFNSMIELYNTYSTTPSSIIAPLYLMRYSSKEFSKTLYDILSTYLIKNPNSIFKKQTTDALKALSAQSVDIDFPQNAAPKEPFNIHIKSTNKNSLTISVFNLIGDRKIGQLIEKFNVHVPGNIPFETDTVISISIDQPGDYTIIPDYSQQQQNKYFSKIHISTIYPYAVSLADKSIVAFASDIYTGQPIKDVSIKSFLKNNTSPINQSVTDYNGCATIKEGNLLKFIKENNTSEINVYNYSAPSSHSGAQITTSLPIYKLGAHIEWAAVCWTTSYTNQKTQPLNNVDIRAILHDANHQPIDTLFVKTDSFGRTNGSFVLPETGLTGNYSIYLSRNNNFIGNVFFTVSDYKLPTFNVEITDIKRNHPISGDVSITGKALTYSGFPVSEAEIVCNLKAIPSFWWRSQAESFYSTTTSTDINGNFSITISSETLKSSPISGNLYSVVFDVTSNSGETRSVSTVFSMGKPYYISTGNIDAIDTSFPVKLPIEVFDALGKPSSIPLLFKLFNNKNELAASFELSTPDSKINLSDIESGVYSISISAVDSSLADSSISKDIILYNSSKLTFNAPELLWTPNSSVVFEQNNGSILLATDKNNIFVNYIVHTSTAIISQKWITLSRGITPILIELPDSVSSATVLLSTVFENNSKSISVNVTTPIARRKLSFKIETFRNNVVPNSTETWTFKTEYPVDTPERCAVILNLFSQSIDDIKAHNPFKIREFIYPSQIHVHSLSTFGKSYASSGNRRWFRFSAPSFPDFNLYNLNWFGSNSMRRYNTVSSLSLRTTLSKSTDIEEEVAFDAAEPMMAGGVLSESKVMSSETADNGENIDDAEEISPDASDEKNTSQNAFRPSEIPLALFEPSLTTDSTGRLSFSFTYPDASTTWLLFATAFDRNLSSAFISKSIVASKPIMVQGNFPRFLRFGDNVELTATIMNATDSAATDVEAELSIISPVSGMVLTKETLHLDLQPMQSQIIHIPFIAPESASGVIIRVKAISGKHSDGEQSFIALLPASQKIIETTPFYISPDSTSFSISFSGNPQNNVSLEFIENPTWSVVSALPGIITDKTGTANSAAASYFSAAIADGIINRNPEINKVLHQWLDSNKTDSTLTSMLNRNPQLKTILLDATPWVSDAMPDSERMTRLALLFNKSELSGTFSNAIETLSKLQRENGGWAWISNSDKASLWATENALLMFGHLNRMSITINNYKLNRMISEALIWLDSEVSKQYHSKTGYSPNLLYSYLRTLFPKNPISFEAKQVTQASVRHIIANWKSFSLSEKAISAMILNSNGYTSTAKQILESISEFASQTPEKGMWWDNLHSSLWWSQQAIGTTALILEAYSLISPDSPDIDKIRQWLIIEKTANNWGSSVTTCQVISDILSYGSNWTSQALKNSSLAINNNEVIPDNFEKVSGYLKTNISSLLNKSGDNILTVNKTSGAPSFGAIYSISNKTMTSVSSHSINGLSIEKKLFVRLITPEGEKWEERTSFTVGDIVKITYIIKTNSDLSYVAITDNRAACMEPIYQLPENIYSDGIIFYRETKDDATNTFITQLPRGTYILEQKFTVTQSGYFTSGVATIQSQYAPGYTASSSGCELKSQEN